MAKIIAWLIVIFVVLLALRIVNMRNARLRRAKDAAGSGARQNSRTAAAPMVRCVRCGIYLPRDEAREVRGGYACIGGDCAAHA